MTTVWVYALRDPCTNLVFYVGQTNDLQRRYQAHLHDKTNPLKAMFVRESTTAGLRPELVPLVQVEPEQAAAVEEFFIRGCAAKGAPLANDRPVGLPFPEGPFPYSDTFRAYLELKIAALNADVALFEAQRDRLTARRALQDFTERHYPWVSNPLPLP